MSVLVVGNAVLDICYRVPRLPRPGETLLATARSLDVGGKGLNQAIAARRAGASVGLVAPVGRDAAAERIRAVLVGEGLDPGLLVATDAPTDESVIWVADDGENAIVSTMVAAECLSPANVTAVSTLGGADTLLLHGGIPVATTARCLELARDRGARVVVNTAPLVPGAELLVPVADVLVVNAGEARGLSNEEEPAAAAEAMDTTGAGDVFTGVLVAALDAGGELREAVAWAARAASLKVARRGTVAGFPTAAELAALRGPDLPSGSELRRQ